VSAVNATADVQDAILSQVFAPLYANTDRYEILGIAQNQETALDGRLTDTAEVLFKLPDREGALSVRVFLRGTDADAIDFWIMQRVSDVRDVYALAV
jgi:hypothetical protein